MDAVLVRPLADLPAAWLAERSRLGLDRRDEVWEGVLHVVPAPSTGHQRLEIGLVGALAPAAARCGLEVLAEVNLIPVGESAWEDYRVPDIVVFRPELDVGRAVEGPASLVVEIRSPGDESLAKLGFYERVGVGEVLVVDRDTKAVRRWVLGPAGLVERAVDGWGRHHLRSVPVALGAAGGAVLVTDGRAARRV